MRIVSALVALVTLAYSSPGLAAGKVALVIGNDAYRDVTPLERAVADARAYRDMLSRERGFDVVYAEDADRNAMIGKIGEFLGKVRRDDVAMVVYSGHGVQLDPNRGDTLYLLPTDIPSVDPGAGGANFFMDARAINFARLSAEVEGRGASLRLFVLDACRNNPFPPAEGGRSIGLTRGLGNIRSSRGEFIFFAAAPGEVALDLLPGDDPSGNSVFTRVFLKHFRQGAYLEDVANDVQAEVLELSRRAAISQEPYYTDGVAGKTCIDEQCGAAEPAPAPSAASDLEATYWRLCETRDTQAYCRAYLDAYPDGPHAPLARLLIAELEGALAAGTGEAKPRVVTVGPASVTSQTPDPNVAKPGAELAAAPTQQGPEPVAAAEPEPVAAPEREPEPRLAAVVPTEPVPSVERQQEEEALRARRREAAEAWSGLENSWDMRAIRAFRQNYPDAEQRGEAERRIEFLRQRHREAQAELNRLGYEAGPVDGDWGRRSAAAMVAFQGDNDLPRDGVVSEESLYRLKTATPRATAEAATRTPQPAAPSSAAQPQAQAPAPAESDPGGGGLSAIIGALTDLGSGRIGGTTGGADGAPEPQPQPDSQVAIATPGGIPDGGRWTAKGETDRGSAIVATLTRSGDRLQLEVEFDHRDNSSYYPWMIDRYSKSCTVSASAAEFDCWFTGDVTQSRPSSPGARVRGTLPRLSLEAHNIIGRVVLDLRPAP